MEVANNFEKNSKLFNKLTNYYIIPLDRTKPPNTKNKSVTNEPYVLATTVFLPIAAADRNNAEAIWFRNTSRRYSLNNLQCIHQYVNWKRT